MMGYFLCLKRCFKKYLLYRGYVAEDTPGKYLIPLSIQGKGPEGKILTRPADCAILASNDEYDRKRKLIDKDYEGLYKNRKGKFFVVKQDGQGASLEVIDKNEAEKIYRQLPCKIVISETLFLPPEEVKERSTSEMLEQWEKERPEREYDGEYYDDED